MSRMARRIIIGTVLIGVFLVFVLPWGLALLIYPKVIKESYSPDRQLVAQVVVKPARYMYFIPPLLYVTMLAGPNVDVVVLVRDATGRRVIANAVLTIDEDCEYDAEEVQMYWESNDTVSFTSRRDDDVRLTIRRGSG